MSMDHFPILSFLICQFKMIALFNQFTVDKNQNTVGLPYSR